MEILPKDSTELVEVIDNEICVSHRTIALSTDNQEVAISNLINKYKSNIEEFGKVHFKNEALKNSTTGQSIKTYFLNEQQATFLMTLLRNNPTVVKFKKNLVKAFYEQSSILKNKQKSKNNSIDILTQHTILDTLNFISKVDDDLKSLKEQITYKQKSLNTYGIRLKEVSEIESLQVYKDKQVLLQDTLEVKIKMEQMEEALRNIPLSLLQQNKQTSTHKMISRFNDWMKENVDNFEWKNCKAYKNQNKIPIFFNFGCINGRDETISISVKELNIFCDENNFSNRTFLKIFEDRKMLLINNNIDENIYYKGYVYKIKGFPESILHLSFNGCGGNVALCG